MKMTKMKMLKTTLKMKTTNMMQPTRTQLSSISIQHVRQEEDDEDEDKDEAEAEAEDDTTKTIAVNAKHNQSTCQISDVNNTKMTPPIDTITMILIETNEIAKQIIASLNMTLRTYEEMNNTMTRISSILRRRRLTLSLPRPHDTSMTDKNNPPFLQQEEVTPVPTMATQLQLQPKQTDDATTAMIAANARRHNQLRPKPIHWMFPPPRTHNRRL
jgi:hypothetical protein